MAAGIEGTMGTASIEHSITIVTETDILSLPVRANILLQLSKIPECVISNQFLLMYCEQSIIAVEVINLLNFITSLSTCI